ncbi:hypothetical protein GCM10011390_41980 [Aureimonas endophytica]|uniref:Uncharacterized protein n=1 Tax=Aureimonas endophytica TaxID=2027858 RepID=A0A916ZY04_9HYPH|nr:hypothetical protein GCM10011390_41980 [Aureimonas endophytica]
MGAMSDVHLDPARTVIAKVGGVNAVAMITGKSLTRVYRWMYSQSRGGTGGFIPQKDAAKLLAHAKANRIKLSPADFFPAEERGAVA